MTTFLYIDCGHTGISGDLILSSVGSLSGIDELQNFLRKVVEKIAPNLNITVNLEEKPSFGIRGTYLNMVIPKNQKSHDHQISSHSTEPHYDMEDFDQDLDNALKVFDFQSKAKEYINQVKELLMTVESEVHGIPKDQVHLHEIGAIDTIIDIVGSAFCFQKLGVFAESNATSIFFPPIAVGGGMVKFSHGTFPVPAPATARLLEQNQLCYKYGPVDFELATPTGVAILSVLKKMKLAIQKRPDIALIMKTHGIGIGTLQLENIPNILESFLGETVSSRTGVSEEKILVLETNLDDVRGEIMGNLISILLEKKALDVSIIPCTTKKSRPGFILKVIANPVDQDMLIRTIMEETGTLGVRICEEQRKCLNRDIIETEITLDNQKFLIHIKRALDKNSLILQEKLEFDDLKKIADLLHLPIRIIENRVKNLLKLSFE